MIERVFAAGYSHISTDPQISAMSEMYFHDIDPAFLGSGMDDTTTDYDLAVPMGDQWTSDSGPFEADPSPHWQDQDSSAMMESFRPNNEVTEGDLQGHSSRSQYLHDIGMKGYHAARARHKHGQTPKWYKERRKEEKEAVITLMCQYWYGCNDRQHRKMTCKHVGRKFSSEDFDKVLYSKGIESVLAEVTNTVSKKFAPRTKIAWSTTEAPEPSDAASNKEAYDAWYKAIGSKEEKKIVIRKMCDKWFRSYEKKDRTTARYRIRRHFSEQDFQNVLHSDHFENEDAVLDEIAMRTMQANNAHLYDSNVSSEDDESSIPALKEPHWYKILDRAENKRYVITRMTYMWYKQIDDPYYREKARKNIIRKFSPEDFELVANPNTSDETLLEISTRTDPNRNDDHKHQVLAMKKDILERGLMKPTTLRLYVKDALELGGYSARPVEELRDHVLQRWALRGNPT